MGYHETPWRVGRDVSEMEALAIESYRSEVRDAIREAQVRANTHPAYTDDNREAGDGATMILAYLKGRLQL